MFQSWAIAVTVMRRALWEVCAWGDFIGGTMIFCETIMLFETLRERAPGLANNIFVAACAGQRIDSGLLNEYPITGGEHHL